MMEDESSFKRGVVELILTGKPEEALELLSHHYGVETPQLRVGMPRSHRKHAGCYVAGRKTVYVANRDNLYNPYVVLHEFYHHLRTRRGEHRGTEKHAESFAKEYLEAYQKITS